MDHLDFEMFPWNVDDLEIEGKQPMYVQDMNDIRKMYKLKNIYENQKVQQPNSNNWNFGSVPPQLMKKSS